MRLLWLALAGKVVLKMSPAAMIVRPKINSNNLHLRISALPCCVLSRAESEKTVAKTQSGRSDKKYQRNCFVVLSCLSLRMLD